MFERHDGWYVGYIPEVPGVNAQERTLSAARRALVTALHEMAEIDPSSVVGTRRTVERIPLEVPAR